MGSAYVGGPSAMVALDAEELIAAARTATGLDDFGDPSWEEPFRLLIDALETEAQLHTVGGCCAGTTRCDTCAPGSRSSMPRSATRESPTRRSHRSS